MSRKRSTKSNPVMDAAEEAASAIDHDRLPKGGAKQVGSTLSRGPGMMAQYLFPNNLSRLAEYEKAYRTDETVGAGIEFIKLALIASVQEYYHPDKEIQTFVRKALDEMVGNVQYAIGELAESSLVFGHSVSEILWQLVDGRIQIEELINYHPASLLIVPNVNGRLIDKAPLDNPFWQPPAGVTHCGIWQLSIDGATYTHIPMSKSVLTIHGKRSGVYTGTSSIQKIYKNWTLKDIVLEMYNVALDRYGTPVSYAVVPAGMTPDMVLDPATGKPRNKTIREAAEEAMANISRGTSLVFQRPSQQDDITIGTLTTGNNFGTVFLDAINYYNRAIFRGLLIPHLLLEEGSAGLSNPGQTHWNVFKLMIQAIAREIVDAFCEQVIGRMIKLNFKDTRPGRFIIEPFDPAVATTMAAVFEKLVKYGYLDPSSQDDLNEVREMFGLPTKDFQPVLDRDQHVGILTAPAEKVRNDKLKAEATMAKAKSSDKQVAHTTGRAQDHQEDLDRQEMELKKQEIEFRKQELNMRRQELKAKQEVDREKMARDHELKLMTQKQTHQQNMAAISKGLVAQPAMPEAKPAPKAPKVSNKTSATPKPKSTGEK